MAFSFFLSFSFLSFFFLFFYDCCCSFSFFVCMLLRECAYTSWITHIGRLARYSAFFCRFRLV